MFLLNLKKDWKMHKSLLITFLVIACSALVVVFAMYLVLKFANVSETLETILTGVWQLISGLVMMLSSFLPIALMVMLLKNDLGKNNVHYTIFTPQSILEWYLPKVLFVFVIQGLFGVINAGYTYLFLDVIGGASTLDTKTTIASLVVDVFSFGFFALLTLCMALFYSFRKKIVSWALIVTSAVIYGISAVTYTIISTLQQLSQTNTGTVAQIDIADIFIQYGIDCFTGLVMIVIALYLFNKKVEY